MRACAATGIPACGIDTNREKPMGKPVSLPPPGLRERNKIERLRRIRQAAHDLFVDKGFVEATMRDIAERADVGFGTLFRYASDKRDLLFLLCIDEFEGVVRQSFANADAGGPLLNQLLRAFGHFFRFFAAHPEISRDLMREMAFYAKGTHAARVQAIVHDTEAGIAALVDRAKQSRQIATSHESNTVARLLFDIYKSECRRFLKDEVLSVRKGLANLRRVLVIVIEGLQPLQQKPRPPRTKKRRAAPAR